MEDYLTVEKIRFEETLHTSIAAEPAVRETMVPPAIIQPLVENALHYGQPDSGSGVLSIAISALIREGHLRVAVENSGPWVDHPPRPHSRSQSHGTGLANLRRRLEVIYGGRAGMVIEHDQARVRVTVRIPVEAVA
jgi:LytS/YehU family sensor histidine kinase